MDPWNRPSCLQFVLHPALAPTKMLFWFFPFSRLVHGREKQRRERQQIGFDWFRVDFFLCEKDNILSSDKTKKNRRKNRKKQTPNCWRRTLLDGEEEMSRLFLNNEVRSCWRRAYGVVMRQLFVCRRSPGPPGNVVCIEPRAFTRQDTHSISHETSFSARSLFLFPYRSTVSFYHLGLCRLSFSENLSASNSV